MQEIHLKTYIMKVHKLLPVFPEHSSRTDVPFPAPRSQPKKMAHYGYGWYTQEQLEDYYDQLIGNFFNIISIFRILLCIFVIFLSQVTTPRL